jgi:hypothetical protein
MNDTSVWITTVWASFPPPPGLEDCELATLNVDFQEIEVFDFAHIVQLPGRHFHLPHHLAQRLEHLEQIQRCRVGLEQAGHAGSTADIQGMNLAITHRVGQVPLKRPLLALQLGQRLLLGLEAGHAAQAGLQHRLVRRVTIDGIGTDIDHLRQARRVEQRFQCTHFFFSLTAYRTIPDSLVGPPIIFCIIIDPTGRHHQSSASTSVAKRR